jgi:hypothetical protein
MSIAELTQLSAHFQHDVHARLLTTTGFPLLISMMSSGQTSAQTPVLSQTLVSIVTGIGALRGASRGQRKVEMETFQGAV